MNEFKIEIQTPEQIKERIRAEELARLRAENERNAANLDYLAMMADVEIPTEEVE